MVEVTPPGGADGDGDSSSGSADTDRDKRDDRDETPTSSTPGTGGGNIRDPSEHTGESESADRGDGGNGSTGESETKSDAGEQQSQETEQGRELTERSGYERFQRESLRHEIADEAGEDVSAQDVELETSDGRVTEARLEQGPQTRGGVEILASNQVAQENEGIQAEDVNVEVGPDGSVSDVSVSEDAQRQQVREQVAAQYDTVNPDEVIVGEGNDQFVSGGDARLAAESGTDGSDLQVQGYQIDFEEGAFTGEFQEGNTRQLDESDAVDTGNVGTTQSTRGDVAPPGMAQDDGPLSSELNRLNRNANVDREDLGDDLVNISINGRSLESVWNEGAEMWREKSEGIGEAAGDAVGVVERGDGEGALESTTESVVTGGVGALDPYSIGSATQETVETVGYVGQGITSGDPSEAVGRVEDATSQASVAGGTAATYAVNNPAETAGGIVSGYLTGAAATSAASRVTSTSPQRMLPQGRTASDLWDDSRGQADFGRTASRERSESSSRETETTTITRDHPDADASDLTPEEWADQLFEETRTRDVDTDQQVFDETLEIDIGRGRSDTRSRSQSPEDQLPPKEEFPSEEAYQRELERVREQQGTSQEARLEQRQEQLQEPQQRQQQTGQRTVDTDVGATAAEAQVEAAGSLFPDESRTIGALAGLDAESESAEMAAASEEFEQETTVGQTLQRPQEAMQPAGLQTEAEGLGTLEATRQETMLGAGAVADTESMLTDTFQTETTATATDTLTTTETTTATTTMTDLGSPSRPRPRLPFPDPSADDSASKGGGQDGIAEDILTDFGNPLTGETLETDRDGGGVPWL